MNSKILAVIAVGAMILAAFTLADTEGAEGGFDITDDTGTTVHFDGAVDRIVLNGKGLALTIADAGAVDKIAAVDKWSTYESTGYEQLKDLDAKNLGSFYGTSNHDYICTELINMVEAGEFSLDDAVLLTSYSSNKDLRDRLNGLGFTKVLVWLTADVAEYDDIVDFVGDVSMIATGAEGPATASMREKIESVTSVVSQVPEGERTKVLPLWYSSSSGWMVNNKGIASSMLDICNTVNIGYDGSVDSGWYGDVNTVISLLDENPGTVIFLPSSWESADKTVQDFRDEVLKGNTSFQVVQMGALWNNYCPESADGLVEMAHACYPELFGLGPQEPADGGAGTNDSILLWAAALAAVAIIGAAAYVVFKRTHG